MRMASASVSAPNSRVGQNWPLANAAVNGSAGMCRYRRGPAERRDFLGVCVKTDHLEWDTDRAKTKGKPTYPRPITP